VQRRRNTPSNFLIRSIQMADGFVFVYDIGSEASLHEAVRLHCFVTQIRPEVRIPMVGRLVSVLTHVESSPCVPLSLLSFMGISMLVCCEM
jgi:hypothetical protein